MRRLIDADRLKEYIHSQNGRPVIGMTFGEMIRMFIDEQPTVEAKPVEWISCFDKLPQDGERVIACFCTGTVTELLYEGKGKFLGLYEYTKDVISAWMPLPAPYKEDMRGGKNER